MGKRKTSDRNEPVEFFLPNIGCCVEKSSGCPFKSSLKVNTVIGVVWSEERKAAMYTFQEDESQVECWCCAKIGAVNEAS